MMEIAAENRQLTEPFKRHLDDVEELKEKLIAHEKVTYEPKDSYFVVVNEFIYLEILFKGFQ